MLGNFNFSKRNFFLFSTISLILAFATLWTFFEWIRSIVFSGFPWNLIGTVWGNVDEVMQFAAIGGIYGLGFLTVIFFTMPAVIIDRVLSWRQWSFIFLGLFGFAIIFARRELSRNPSSILNSQ